MPTATENDAVAIFKLIYENKHRLNAVYLSTNGDDSNAGTKDAPYATLDKALASVPNDGTIIIADNYALADDFEWEERSKAVTITGANSDVSLDFTAMSANIVMGNDVTFENITLTFDTSDNLFANGHKLVVKDGVTTPNLINVYGGGKGGSTVASTNVTVLSGSYENIYGGSYYGTVTGDTWLTVGGNVNPGDSVAVHDGNTGQRIYAGGNNDTIGGNTHCTFEGNAQAYQLFGGSVGANAQIAGGSNIEFNSGKVYGILGGNNQSSIISGTNVTVNGGTIAQIFGANQNASMTGDVDLKVLGGTITRRIYGGCYNEVELWESWDSSYHVTGNINLTISGNATLSLNQETDNGFYVCSRYKEAFTEEVCTIKYYNSTGYTHYQAKKGNFSYMSSVLPHDEEVYLY